MKNLTGFLLGGQTPFEQNFRTNEYAAIAGRGGGKTLLWLSLILGATLAALAFGIGSLDQLRVRMDNPFTNIVDKGIYLGDRPNFERVRKQLLEDDLGAAMGLDTITDWSIYTLNVYPAAEAITLNSKGTRSLRGRTVDYTSTLFNFIFISENILYGKNFRGQDYSAANSIEAGGIIVKASVLEELGYPRGDFGTIRSLPIYQNTLDAVFFIPVHAIVTDLPSNADFATSKDFYLSLYGDDCADKSFVYNREGDNNLRFVVPANQADSFSVLARKIISDPDAELEIDRRPYPTDGLRELEVITLSVRLPYVRGMDDYYAGLTRSLSRQASELAWVPFTEYVRTREPCTKEGAQQASFVFHRLDQIREFREFLLEESGIDLPIEVVENKENFAMVSLLGYSTGVMLLLFSLASICFFIRNLIEGHLNSVKPNLGTFKAFGMPNSNLVRHYQRILFTLLALSLAIGSLAAGLAGILIRAILGPGYFNLLSWWILGAVVFIFGFSLLFSRGVVSDILSRTPGDLVYGRS